MFDQTVPGPPPAVKDKALETGASLTQDFALLKSVCAHLNAFHIYTRMWIWVMGDGVGKDGGLEVEGRREKGGVGRGRGGRWRVSIMVCI